MRVGGDARAQAAYVRQLAGLETLEFRGWSVGAGHGEARARACARLHPAGGIVDRAGEIAKLQKELAGVDKEASALAVKLANERFVEHAPAAVVEERARGVAARGASPEAASHAGGAGRVTPAPLDPSLPRGRAPRAGGRPGMG